MNKKGNFNDIIEWLQGAMVLGIGALLVITFILNANTTIQSMDNSVVSSTSKNVSSNYADAIPKGFDYLFILGFLVFVLFSFVAARLIPSTPKFWLIGIVFIIGLTILAMFMEDVASGFLNNPQLLGAISNLTIIPFALNNLRYFVLFYAGIVALGLYTKNE